MILIASKVQIIEFCTQNSRIWSSVAICRLTQNTRAHENERALAKSPLKLNIWETECSHGQTIIDITTNNVCAEEWIAENIFKDIDAWYNVEGYLQRVLVSSLSKHLFEINYLL